METKKFSFRCIAYQEKDETFTGVCLDLDIVEEGHATLQEAILSINDAILSHLGAAAKSGFPKELIDRPAPDEYWEKLRELTNPIQKHKEVLSNPFKFYNTSPYVTI